LVTRGLRLLNQLLYPQENSTPNMSRPPALTVHLTERLTFGWRLLTALLAALLTLLAAGSLHLAGVIPGLPAFDSQAYFLVGLSAVSIALGWVVLPRLIRIIRKHPLYTLDGTGFTDHRRGEVYAWDYLQNPICDEIWGHILLSLERTDITAGASKDEMGPRLVYISGWSLDISAAALTAIVGDLLSRQDLAA